MDSVTVDCTITAMILLELHVETPKEKRDTDPIEQFRCEVGSPGLRERLIELAEICNADFDTLTSNGENWMGPFDWEFCPRWLGGVRYENYELLPPTDEHLALVKRELIGDGWVEDTDADYLQDRGATYP